MSGGSLGYFYSDLEYHVGDFKDRELDDLVKDLSTLFHEREWFLSGDKGEGDWVEARDEFKKKWFTEHGRQERVEKYLDDLRSEVMASLGLSDRYCKNCTHWEKEDGEDPKYGRCRFVKGCVMHRSETCEKFEHVEVEKHDTQD